MGDRIVEQSYTARKLLHAGTTMVATGKETQNLNMTIHSWTNLNI